jgi:hypothetical protein
MRWSWHQDNVPRAVAASLLERRSFVFLQGTMSVCIASMNCTFMNLRPSAGAHIGDSAVGPHALGALARGFIQ